MLGMNSAASPNVAPYLLELVGMVKRLDSGSDSNGIIRFFQKGNDSYEVLGENAALICDLVFRTDSSLKKIPVGGSSNGWEWLTLTSGQLSIALRDLVLEGSHYFEFYTQEPGSGWKCTLRASPGNLEPLEHLLYANNEESNTVASFGNQSVIGALFLKRSGDGSILVHLAYIDELQFGVAEFADNDLLMHTEAALVQLGIKEVLIPETSQDDYRRVVELCKTTEVMCTRMKNVEFDAHVGHLDLPRLLKIEHALEASLLSENIQKCAAAVISYLQFFRHDANIGTFSLIRYASNAFMRLDDSALKSLLLLPSNVATEKKSCTLFGLLNQCKTQQGGRLLAQWIRQPLRNLEMINERLDLVQFFIDDSNLRHNIREKVLRGLADLSRIVRKLIKQTASLQDLAVAYDALGRGVQLADMLRSAECPLVQEVLVKPLDKLLRLCLPFIKMIYASLDFEAMSRHEFLIKPTFDQSLEKIGEEQKMILADLEEEARKVASQTHLEFGKKLKLERNATYGGYTLRVSRLDIPAVQKIEQRVDLAVLKSGLIFVTPEFKRYAQAYEEQGREYAEKQQVIVREMRQTALTYIPMFEQFNSVIAVLDVLMSLAQAAVIAPIQWTRPQFQPNVLHIKNSRHALVEMRASLDGDLFIPNDALLTKNGKEEEFHFGIITGPNMGGKSTFMRQVGIIAVMAQLGSFVPAEHAILPLFDSVMVRVGAGDSLLKGISTFLSEMLQMSAIIKLATSHSLVLVDELGRGTSSEEGTYIARCLVEHLIRNVSCWGYFATHFHELAEIEIKRALGNLHVGLDAQGNGEFRVRPGANKQSLGIALARKLGYPESVLQVAQMCFDLFNNN